MELDLGPQYSEFRAEMRSWISNNAPAGLEGLANWGWQPVAGGRQGAQRLKAMEDPIYREWEARLSDAHLICATWPEQYGGRGWDAVRFAVFNEELRRHGVPVVRRGMGETLVGPAIIVHGTPEQKAYFLPRIVAGVDVYCQGYSEPDHGSDLGAVETRGVVDGDELVIISTHGMVIRQSVKDIRVMGRNTQGVRVIRLSEGDKIADIAKVVPEEVEGDENGNGNGSNGKE